MAPRNAADSPPQPHKRPSQARARFTVRAIYEAFVRIWRRDGPEAATTRAIALEAGYAVGTLYEYFPNRTALLSGYVRHYLDCIGERLDRFQAESAGLDAVTRVRRLLQITLGEDPDTPYFDRDMLLRENRIAELSHHRRSFEQLADKWVKVMQSWTDLPRTPEPESIRRVFTSIWGGRRYLLLLDATPEETRAWTDEMVRLVQRLLDGEAA